MANLNIIKEIEKILNVRLKKGSHNNGYDLGLDNNIITLNLPHIGSEKVQEIVPHLNKLDHIVNLDLTGNELIETPLIKLNSLKKLDLSNNRLKNIKSLSHLLELEYLDLSRNNLTNITPLKALTNLNYLDLYTNKIQNISSLKHLTNLEVLHLSQNKIVDISAIKDHVMLISLGIWGNKIIDISSLKNLKRLRRLYLWDNPIKEIPIWITDFNMKIKWDNIGTEGYVSIKNESIISPPIHIIQGGNQAIKNYFSQIDEDKGKIDYLFEAKLLVIGEGGTGKTTFTKKIQDSKAEMPQDMDTTLGIEVGKWSYKITYPKLNTVNFNVNLWDFGGQKIYQGTHQIFFSDKSFYVLITDTREQKTDFSYWLNTVEQLGGENSSLIIILNKKFGHELKFDESGYRNHFGKIIKDIIEIDLKNDEDKLKDLQNQVKMHIKKLPGIGDPLPPSWINIREDLLKENGNFISFDNFRAICKKNKIIDASMIHTLSGYFNRIGAFTHYIDDPLLQERIYLNSNWLVKTVYEVLDNKIAKEKKGRLSEANVKKMWANNELHYEVNKLTQLMHKFGLMYHIPNTDKYVIPAHLPTITPYKMWPYSGKGNILQFIYEFDKYMPQGIMSRLIVALNHHIEDHNLVWHRGLNLELNGAYAEIIESYGASNHFEIKIIGVNKIELLSIIRERFAEVLKPFNNLNYKQFVPCICSECKSSQEPAFHDYNLLLKFREKGTGSQCSKTGEIISAEELLKITIANKTKSLNKKENNHLQTIKMFLASSSELKEDRDEFRKFISLENDRLHKEGVYVEILQWEYFIDAMSQNTLQDEYNKTIKDCDIFLSLFFTKVGKYTAEEFETAFGKFRTAGKPFIYTYFKDATINTNQIKKEDINSKFDFEEKLQKLGHFKTVYKNIDDLKNQFRFQLEKIIPKILS